MKKNYSMKLSVGNILSLFSEYRVITSSILVMRTGCQRRHASNVLSKMYGEGKIKRNRPGEYVLNELAKPAPKKYKVNRWPATPAQVPKNYFALFSNDGSVTGLPVPKPTVIKRKPRALIINTDTNRGYNDYLQLEYTDGTAGEILYLKNCPQLEGIFSILEPTYKIAVQKITAIDTKAKRKL